MKSMANTHVFSKGEEVANAITHGIGALLSVAAMVILIVFASIHGTVWHIVGFALFGVTMLLLYICSTLVHSFPQGKAKDVFEIMDHASIYFFIAGTYTPFLFIAVKGTLGWTLFGMVWGFAIAGTVFLAFFVGRFVYLSSLLYLFRGWMIVVAWGALSADVTVVGMIMLLMGGVFYSIGPIVYVVRG